MHCRFLVFFKRDGHHRDLHSFPTRRSSDLPATRISGAMTRNARRRRKAAYHPARGNVAAMHAPDAAANAIPARMRLRSEEHTSELQSHVNLVCRLLLEKKNKKNQT